MKTSNATDPSTTPKLPPPIPGEDRVNDLGWWSRGPTRRAEKAAKAALQHLLLEDGEESILPPDPEEPPPLPPPLEEEPDTEYKGARPDGIKSR